MRRPECFPGFEIYRDCHPGERPGGGSGDAGGGAGGF